MIGRADFLTAFPLPWRLVLGTELLRLNVTIVTNNISNGLAAKMNDEGMLESAFFDALTLGLTRLLESTPGVVDVERVTKEPCEKSAISTWEQRHACTLPKDIRNFYQSIDGFQLTWRYNYAGEIMNIGYMFINSLANLRRIYATHIYENELGPSDIDMDILDTSSRKPSFKTSKIFELDPCKHLAKICLVYLDDKSKPTIWLLDRSYDWHFIASTFSQYFRMMLVYQGLPEWFFVPTTMGMSSWANQFLCTFAPHLKAKTSTVKMWTAQTSHLDPNIFKTKSKAHKAAPRGQEGKHLAK